MPFTAAEEIFLGDPAAEAEEKPQRLSSANCSWNRVPVTECHDVFAVVVVTQLALPKAGGR